jgi:hypothetical protein
MEGCGAQRAPLSDLSARPGSESLLGVGGHEKGEQSENYYGKDHYLVFTAAGSERFVPELFLMLKQHAAVSAWDVPAINSVVSAVISLSRRRCNSCASAS